MQNVRQQKLNASYVLIALNVIYFIIIFISDPSLSNITVVQFGAKFNPFIADGQLYRLVSAAFIHLSITHLLMNGFALYIIGPEIESLFGKLRFIIIYFGAAIMGTAMSYYFSPHISAGASGAIFGLLGTHVYLFIRKPSVYLNIYGKSFLVMIGLNILIGLSSPSIDNFGHFGGLLGGVLIAPLTGIQSEKFPKLIGIATFLVYLGLLWFFLRGNGAVLN